MSYVSEKRLAREEEADDDETNFVVVFDLSVSAVAALPTKYDCGGRRVASALDSRKCNSLHD